MKRVNFSVFALLAALMLSSCADNEDRVYTGEENVALEKWMELHRPELVENRQADGDYYIDIFDAGDQDMPVNDTVYWVRFKFEGRDLAGNVCLTRNELTARQMGSFTRYTHYVPMYRYCGVETANLMDGIHKAFINQITLGEAYSSERGLDRSLTLGKGAKFRLYMPSTIVGGLSGSGGYEGQDYGGTVYSLSKSRPLIADIEVLDLVKNPLEYEGGVVDGFAEQNGGLKPVEEEDEKTSGVRGADEPQYNDGYQWRNAVDSVPQLYIDHTFKPTLDRSKLLKYANTYSSTTSPYNNIEELDLKINEALLERFGEGTLEGDSVKLAGTAKIWYIGRFLDGFIFDTNIDEVKKLVFGEVSAEGSALSYCPETDESDLVSSWFYSVPQLRYGQWATFVGTSTYNYGATGQDGTTSTSTTYDSSYYDMINYYNYMNSYYGNSYYGGYYNNYYNNYYYGYYDDYYYNNDMQYESTTVTTVSTEIQSYTPLMFQIYIEPKSEE